MANITDIVIDASQYTNFKTVYSEKNNIDNINGIEYRVTGTKVVDFSFPNNNEYINENGEMNIEYVEHNDNDPMPEYSFSKINNYSFPYDRIEQLIDFGTNDTIGIYGNQKSYLREENYVISGTFRAYTTEAIQDINNISVSCEITYNTYRKEIRNPDEQLILNNYSNMTLDPSFEVIRTPSNQVNKNEVDGTITTEIQTTQTALPQGTGQFLHRDPLGVFTPLFVDIKLKYFPPICELSKPRVKVEGDQTVAEIDYRINLWNGYTDVLVVEYGLFGQANFYNYHLNNATKIKFKVQGNSIETAQNEFKYGDGQYKEYELESNELMQYEINQDYTTRQSYLSSQKMLEKNKINRMIVSFDLLKCDKIVAEIIKPSDSDSESITVKRFLNTGDLIKIKDQNDNYIGQYFDDNGNVITPYFEIISYHGIWDGSFHIEVVCKQQI